jgi:hypothetical protein
MKGEVEIISVVNGIAKTILKEDNLIMDGFGETMVSLLTTPSSIVAEGVRGSTGDNQSRLDASNYTIQGLAFGKGTLGYLENKHKFYNLNAVDYSEDLTNAAWESFNLSVSAVSGVTAPDTTSNVFLLTASSISTDKEGKSLCQDTYFNGKQTDGIDDKISFSLDLKYRPELPPDKVDGNRYSTIGIDQNGTDTYLVIKWDSSGNGELLDVSRDTTTNSQFSTGFLKNLGNGWYRACVVPRSETGSGSVYRVRIYPSLPFDATGLGFANPDVRDSLGSIYVSRPMAVMSNFPTDYVPTLAESNVGDYSEYSAPVSLSGIMLGSNSVGTLYTDTSAYNAVANAPEMPNPVNTELEPNAIYSVETISDLVIDGYHNKNFNSFDDIYVSSYLVGWDVGAGASSITSDNLSYHVGCYAPTSGITVASVEGGDFSSLTASAVGVSGSYAELRTMDKDGFIRAYYPTLGDTADASGRLIVSANSDFSSVGELSCITIIPQPDAIVSNFYGGIFEAGLFTLDLQKTLNELKIQPPYNKDVDSGDPFKMKLMARKTFNDNIVVSRDSGSDQGLNHHGDVKVIWRLKFL